MSQYSPEEHAAFSLDQLTYQLAKDYQFYKIWDGNSQIAQIFGRQEAALLKAIAANPEAAELVNNYWNKLPEHQGMPTIGPDPGTSIPFSQYERQVYEDFVLIPSLIGSSALASVFGLMAEFTGHDQAGVDRAIEIGHALGNLADIANNFTQPRDSYRPGDPYERLYSPKEKWEAPHATNGPKPPLSGLGIRGLSPNPPHQRPFQPVAPEGSAKPQDGHPGQGTQYQHPHPPGGTASNTTGGEGTSGRGNGSGDTSGSSAGRGEAPGQGPLPTGNATVPSGAALTSPLDANISYPDGTVGQINIGYVVDASPNFDLAGKTGAELAGDQPDAGELTVQTGSPAIGAPSGAVNSTDGGVATDATLPGGVTSSSADETISARPPDGGPPNSPPDPSVLAGDRDAGHLDAPSVGPANYPDASPADQHLPETSHDSGHDPSAASYDPAYDASAAASYDPSAVGHGGAEHDGAGHDDPVYDASAAASYDPSAVGHGGAEHDGAGHDDPVYDASAAASYDPSAVGHDGAGHDLSSYDPSRDAVSGHDGAGHDAAGHDGAEHDPSRDAVSSHVPGHVGPGHDAAGHDGGGHEGAGHDLSSYDPSRDALSGHFPGHDGSGYDPGYDGAGYDPGYDGAGYDPGYDGAGYDPGYDAAGYDPGYGTDYVAGGVGDGQFGAPPASTPQDLDLHRGAHARNIDMLLAWHWFTTAPYDPSHDGSGVAGGDSATASHNAGHDGSGVPDDHSAMASHDVSYDGSGFDATGADGSGA